MLRFLAMVLVVSLVVLWPRGDERDPDRRQFWEPVEFPSGWGDDAPKEEVAHQEAEVAVAEKKKPVPEPVPEVFVKKTSLELAYLIIEIVAAILGCLGLIAAIVAAIRRLGLGDAEERAEALRQFLAWSFAILQRMQRRRQEEV